MQSVRTRLVLLLLVGVTGAPAQVARAAETPAAIEAADVQPRPAYAPLSAVAIMLGTGQTLLFDETARKYQVAMVGDVVADWKVVTIEETRVIVVHGEERDVLTLVPPPCAIEGVRLPKSATLSAPLLPEADPRPTPAPVAKPKPAAPVEDPTAPRKVSRAELNRELGDFDRLGAAVDVIIAEGGGFRLTRVDKGSWPYRMGLRPGDVIRSVAGERVATVEDAARVYARLRASRAFVIELDRPMVGVVDDGNPPTTRVALQYYVK